MHRWGFSFVFSDFAGILFSSSPQPSEYQRNSKANYIFMRDFFRIHYTFMRDFFRIHYTFMRDFS